MMDCNHLTDAEWAFLRSYVLTHGRGRPPADHRRVLDGLFWLARTGRPWRDLPREFGNWGSVYRQHQRWSAARVWELASEDVAGCTRLPASHVTPHRTLTEEAVAAAGGHDRLLGKLEAARLLGQRPRFGNRPHCGSQPRSP